MSQDQEAHRHSPETPSQDVTPDVERANSEADNSTQVPNLVVVDVDGNAVPLPAASPDDVQSRSDGYGSSYTAQSPMSTIAVSTDQEAGLGTPTEANSDISTLVLNDKDTTPLLGAREAQNTEESCCEGTLGRMARNLGQKCARCASRVTDSLAAVTEHAAATLPTETPTSFYYMV